MHIILGGTGHVGAATANALIDRCESVTIVTHDPAKRAAWEARGAAVAVVDARDVDALRGVFQQGRRLYLVNPPADPATDTDVEERRTVIAILAALQGSGLEKIVAASTYGAQPGERCGDLTILYGLEQALHDQPIPVTMLRAAYYMSNWDASLATARDEGVVHTLFPADFSLPMVAPHDIGQVAARLLMEPAARTGLHNVEGPDRYTPDDVAAAFAAALGRPVKAVATQRAAWEAAFRAQGFSAPAAASYTRMTAVTVDADYPLPDAPIRGATSLQDYVTGLI